MCCVTAYATTPYTPIASSLRPMMAKMLNKSRTTRRCAIELFTAVSSVRRSTIGTVASRSGRRTVRAALSGRRTSALTDRLVSQDAATNGGFRSPPRISKFQRRNAAKEALGTRTVDKTAAARFRHRWRSRANSVALMRSVAPELLIVRGLQVFPVATCRDGDSRPRV